MAYYLVYKRDGKTVAQTVQSRPTPNTVKAFGPNAKVYTQTQIKNSNAQLVKDRKQLPSEYNKSKTVFYTVKGQIKPNTTAARRPAQRQSGGFFSSFRGF